MQKEAIKKAPKIAKLISPEVKQAQENFEPLLTFKQLSEVTGLKVGYLKTAVYQYGLPSYDIVGRRFRLSEVEKWLAGRKA